MKFKVTHPLLLLLFCLMPTVALSNVQLALEVNPDPVRPGEQLDVELTVTNPTSSLMENVKLILRYPEYLNDLSKSYITTGGSANTVTCGAPTYCATRNLVTWNLGNLPPGGGVTVTMPPTVRNGTADGTLIQFEAEVRVAGIQQAQASKTARVKADPFFELTVDEEIDPITSSGNREYILSYGNVATSSSNTQLIFPLPTGTSFISATNGGSEAAGEVTWNIGSLINGAGGERKVTVQVNANEADLLKVDTARLSGTDFSYVFHQVKAGRVTRVEDDERPTLAMNLNPHPVRPNEQLNVELTVTNPGSSLMANVELILRYPYHLNDLNKSYITTGGSANTVTCGAPTYCATRNLVTWNLGNLPPGGGVTVTMPPTVRNGTADGTLIQFEAEVRVAGTQQASISKTAFVGSVFAFIKYTVIADAGVNGSLDNSTMSPQMVDFESTTQFTFNADSNYHVASITGCGVNYTNSANSVTSYMVTTGAVTANCAVAATFAINTYTVTSSLSGGHGTINPSGNQTVTHGDIKQFFLMPETEYHVDQITGSCGGVLSGTTFTTNAIFSDCTVIAAFSDKYALSIVFAGNGSGNVTMSNTPIEIDTCTANCNADLLHDTEVTLSATADKNTTFVGWSGDGCTGKDDCSVTMNQAREITAIFSGFPWAMFLPAILGVDRQ